MLSHSGGWFIVRNSCYCCWSGSCFIKWKLYNCDMMLFCFSLNLTLYIIIIFILYNVASSVHSGMCLKRIIPVLFVRKNGFMTIKFDYKINYRVLLIYLNAVQYTWHPFVSSLKYCCIILIIWNMFLYYKPNAVANVCSVCNSRKWREERCLEGLLVFLEASSPGNWFPMVF